MAFGVKSPRNQGLRGHGRVFVSGMGEDHGFLQEDEELEPGLCGVLIGMPEG